MLISALVVLASPAASAENACSTSDERLQNFVVADTPPQVTDVPFTDADGGERRLTDYTGKQPLVVNFWATWCAPCVKEMPQLDRLRVLLKNTGIEVIAISQDRGGLAKVKPFFQKQGYQNLEMLLDPKAAFARASKIRGLPTTLLIDQDGHEVVRVQGLAEWDAPHIVEYIRTCLGSALG